jgi:hypothetical protein
MTYAPDDEALAHRLSGLTGLGEVWRCLRCGEFTLGAPQVDDRAATALDHAGQVAQRQIHHRLDIHAQHLQFLVATFGAELCVDAQSGVVHEDVDLCML